MKGKSLFAVTAAVLALSLGLAACGEDDDEESVGTGTGTQADETTAAPTAPAGETVSLSEIEFSIHPDDVRLDKAGVVEFDVRNDGSITHALEVEGADLEEETEDIAAGDSATLKVDLPEGTYELYCPIGDHKEQGMLAELTVGSGGTSSSDDDSGGAEAPSEDDNSGGAEAPSDDSGY